MKFKILIALLFFNSLLFSQTQTLDVLYLKNGSVIKGSITEMNPASGIKIKTSDGSIFVYKMDEVLKTEKEEFTGNSVNQSTSSVVSQSAINNYFKNYLNQKRAALKLIGVSKKNGIKKEVFGQKIYAIEYELIMETNSNIYINASQFGSAWSNRFVDDFSYSLKGSGGYESALAGAKKLIEQGKRIVATGTLNFEETDNGWRATGFKNESYKTVSSDYISPQIAKRLEEERKEQTAKLKIELDWKTKDSGPVEFNKQYFLVEDVPLFYSGNISYFFKTSSQYNGRNDLLSEIQKTFYDALKDTNRSIGSSEMDFKESNNKTNVRLSIVGISHRLVDKGYQCNISVISYLKGDYKEPKSYTYTRKDKFLAKSNSFMGNMNKRQAFNSALSNLKEKFKDFIFKRQSIKLDVLRFETNKKGKVDEIVFKKPKNFINANRINFLVIEENDLDVINNKISLVKKIGSCKYKGDINDNEIKCKVTSNKDKKSFKDYINTKDKLIGLSAF